MITTAELIEKNMTIAKLIEENKMLLIAAVDFLAECENSSYSDIMFKLATENQKTQQRIETLINFAKNLEDK